MPEQEEPESTDHTLHILICRYCGAADLGKLTFEDNKGWFLIHSQDCSYCGAHLPTALKYVEAAND